MMFRFNSGSFTLRSASRTESSVMSLAGSGCVGVGGCGGCGGCIGSVISSTIANIPAAEQVMSAIRRSRLHAAVLVATLAPVVWAQDAPRPQAKGWELVGLPALNFDSDEGFGYGVLAEAYNYG